MSASLKLGVGLCARDDLVELAPRARKLLGGAHPALRRGRKRLQQPRDSLFVVRHVL